MIINEVMPGTELFGRLRRAMDIIEKNPYTAAEVNELFKEFVESMEEIAVELDDIPDGQIAENLRELFLLSSMN